MSLPEEQLGEVTRLVTDLLGASLLGVCVHGSAVLGGLRPASDLDLLAVVANSLTERQRSALAAGLGRLSAQPAHPRPLELTVVVRSAVNPWSAPGEVDFLWGEWLRDEVEREGPPRPHTRRDLGVMLHDAYGTGRPLVGPAPSRLLAPIPVTDLVDGALAGVPDLLADLGSDTRNVVLTLARVWLTAETGEVRPKDVAADWALARLPVELRPVLDHARRLYLGSRYDEETWPGRPS